MTYALKLKNSTLHKLKGFPEFVFVSDSALKSVSESAIQLQLAPNSSFLCEAEIGEIITIRQIHVPQNTIRQLRNLKFEKGQTVQLVSKTETGSVIVALNNTLVGIGQEIAQRIEVALVGKEKS